MHTDHVMCHFYITIILCILLILKKVMQGREILGLHPFSVYEVNYKLVEIQKANWTHNLK